MVSIDYWVEHQGSRSSLPDTSRVVPVIKGDRAGRPGVEFGGNGLYVSCVDHVYYFDFWWEFFLSPGVRLARLILVFAWRFPSLVFGI